MTVMMVRLRHRPRMSIVTCLLLAPLPAAGPPVAIDLGLIDGRLSGKVFETVVTGVGRPKEPGETLSVRRAPSVAPGMLWANLGAT